jgi:hypothetical protein
MTLSSAGFFAGIAATVIGWGSAFVAASAGALAFLAPLLPIVGIIVAIGVAMIPVIMFIQQFIAVVQEFGIVNAIFMAVTAVVQAFGQIIVGTLAGGIAAIVGFAGAVVTGIGIAVAAIVGGGLKIIAAIASWIEKILGVPPVFSQALNEAANIVLSFVGRFRDVGGKLMTALADGVKSSVSQVTNAIAGAMDTVRSYLPFSDAKKGPLSDLTYSGASIPRTIAGGINENAYIFNNSMSKLFDYPTINAQPISDVQIRELKPLPNQSTISNISTTPINVTINLTNNSNNTQNKSLIEQLKAEGNAIAKIVESAIAKRERTKYA